MADTVKEIKVPITAEDQFSLVLDGIKKRAEVTFQKISAEIEKTGTVSDKLSNEWLKLQRQGQSVEKQIQAQARAHADVTSALEKSATSTKSFTDALKKHWVGLTASAAAVGFAIKTAFYMAEDAAKNEQALMQFQRAVSEAGGRAKEVFEDLKQRSRGMISDDTIVAATNRILAMGVPVEKIGFLMDLARDRAKAMGVTTVQAYVDIGEGVAKASAKKLKQIGIMVDQTTAVKEYADNVEILGAAEDAAGEAIGGHEKQLAIINALQSQYKDSIGETNKELLTQYERHQQIQATIANTTSNLDTAMLRVQNAIFTAFSSIGLMADALMIGILGPFAALEAGLNKLGIKDKEVQTALDEWLKRFNAAVVQTNASFNVVTASQKELTDATKSHTSAVEQEFKATGTGVEILGAANVARSESVTTIAELEKHESDLKAVMDAVNISTKEGQAYYKQLNEELVATKARIEQVQRAAKGLSETHFDLKLKILMDEAAVNPAEITNNIKQRIEQGMSVGGAIKSPLFGVPALSPQDEANIDDRVKLAQELRRREAELFKVGKDEELNLIEDWEASAIEMAHGNEDEITRIKEIGAAERAKIENESLQDFQQQFNQWAGVAQQAVGLVGQAISNSAEAEIQDLQARENAALEAIETKKKNELAAIEQTKQRELAALDARLKRDKLTTAERNALTAQRSELLQKFGEQEAAVSQKADEEKAARAEEFEKQIKDAKRREFEANKAVQMISAIINTAEAVTAALPNIPLAVIVGALGAAEVGIIASQTPPSFHEGGTVPGGMDQEVYALLRGGETVRTVQQERELQGKSNSALYYDHSDHSVKTIIVNLEVSGAVGNEDAVTKAIKEGLQRGMKEMGVTKIDDFIVNQRPKVSL